MASVRYFTQGILHRHSATNSRFKIIKSTCKPCLLPSVNYLCRYFSNINLPPSRTLTSTLIGPSVRKLLHEYDLKQSDVPVSGPYDILLKGDVLNYISDKKLQSKPVLLEKPKKSSKKVKVIEGEFHVDIPLTDSQRNIADRLISTKKSIPHAYMSTDCQVDNFSKYKQIMLKSGKEVTLNDFVIKCAATALNKIPEINVVNVKGKIQRVGSVNIALADSEKLVVLHNAESLSIEQISEQTRQASLLQSRDSTTSGCALRISNLGAFGVVEFCEVVVPPEVAVLAIGADRLVMEDGTPKKKVKVTLSFDNQAVTDDGAGQFLSAFRQCLENPFQILCMS